MNDLIESKIVMQEIGGGAVILGAISLSSWERMVFGTQVKELPLIDAQIVYLY